MLIAAPSPRDSTHDKSPYQKLPVVKETYLAFVVAIRDPLNLHLDIYWPNEISERYAGALQYDYTFLSEELDEKIYTRRAYSCHLRGIEVSTTDSANMKDAYIAVSKNIIRSGGWVLVSVSDIDIYRRVLVNIFDVVTRISINTSLLTQISPRTGEPIAKEYIRPQRSKQMFSPTNNIPKYYHIVYGDTK